MSKKTQLLDQIKSSVDDRVLMQDTTDNTISRAQMEGTKRFKNAKIISIDRIKPDPDQPRQTFDPEKLKELADSIKEHGILQPITVEFIEDSGNGYYKIITGGRRYQAAKMNRLLEMPCVVLDKVSANDRFAKQIIENIQREDLSPIEKALALLEYKEKIGPDAIWADVEKVVGISDRRRKQYIKLLELPENIQKEIVAIGKKPSRNQITEKHARALLLLNNMPEKQLELFKTIKSSKEPVTGDEAIQKAQEIRGKANIHKFAINYRTERELLEKLKEKVKELEELLS